MGDPRKQRKKYSGPQHPWQRTRLEEEKVYVEEYGLHNKKDLWKMSSKLAHFKQQAKSLIARRGEQAEQEQKLFLQKLTRMSLISAEGTIDDVLSLTVKDLLERRLQTLVFRKGLAHSSSQARQFIVHGHIFVHGQKMNVPSYLVPFSHDAAITFNPKSALSDPEHPERQIKMKAEEKKVLAKEEVQAEEKEEIVEDVAE
ncbi:30S ribosomal protein S4 [Candidatus Woesearchaeota archaeon]|nr:30S ribosomal protein S4 [Candidatus Woesearchaeota archaeon]